MNPTSVGVIWIVPIGIATHGVDATGLSHGDERVRCRVGIFRLHNSADADLIKPLAQRLEPAPGHGDGVGRGEEQGRIHGDLLCGIAGRRRATRIRLHRAGRQAKEKGNPAGPGQGGVSVAPSSGRRMQCSGQ